MFYLFVLFILICLIGINFKNVKSIDTDALSRDRTLMINGIFVVIIIFSHFNSYVDYSNKLDLLYFDIVYNKIGQLMVTTFLFFSGYGIYESIKTKKNYINNLFKNRILKLFISFSCALIIYIIINYFLKIEYSISTTLLSFTGWESIGNSNWFIFATFCMYFATLFSFKICKNNTNALILNTIFSLLYIIFIMIFKGYDWWCNTILCYNAGMWFSYYKDSITNFLKNNVSYMLTFIFSIILFLILYINKANYFIFEFCSITFVMLIILFVFKIKIGNKVLLWFGKNTFNIYILQRMVFTLYKPLELDTCLYFIISFVTIIIVSIIFDKLINKIYGLLMK